MNTFIEEIKSRGYWEFTIHPAKFSQNKVSDILSLEAILRKSSVQFRGWDFPHISTHEAPKINKDSICQSTDWEHMREYWQFFQSGLFYTIKGVSEDWRDRSNIYPPYEGWKPNSKIGIFQVVATMTEFFEFSSRLALSEAGDEHMVLKFNLCNIQDRELYADSNNTFIWQPKTSSLKDYGDTITIKKSELISNSAQLAKVHSKEIIKRFNLSPDDKLLETLQAELRKR